MARRTLSGCLLALALLLGSSARAGNDGTLGLAWDPPPPGEQVDGYFLYWGNTPGGPYPSASPPIYIGPSGLYAYTLRAVAVGRVHAVPFAPISALNSLSAEEIAEPSASQR